MEKVDQCISSSGACWEFYTVALLHCSLLATTYMNIENNSVV